MRYNIRMEDKIKAKKAQNRLNSYAQEINPHIRQFFARELKKPFGVSSSEQQISRDVLSHLKEHCLRPAKRLRGALVLAGNQLINGDNYTKDAMTGAISVEIIHTSLLIHDDIMDQDDTRRGKPTTHKYYSNMHEELCGFGDKDHYGNSMAIQIGDIALLLGFNTLAESTIEPKLRIQVLNRLLRGIIHTGYGQAFDVSLEAMGNSQEQDIVDLHSAKTAIYTYENPLHIGALLAGAQKNDLTLLSQYAMPAGIAFQLQDDILGLYGNPEKTGKAADSDLKQRKLTLLIKKAFEFSSDEQRRRLNKIWGKTNLTKKDADEAREIVENTGSLEYSKKLSINYAEKALSVIPRMKDIGWNADSVEFLEGIVLYMVNREL